MMEGSGEGRMKEVHLGGWNNTCREPKLRREHDVFRELEEVHSGLGVVYKREQHGLCYGES